MATTLTLLLVILKLAGVLTWSWWWVASPIIAQVVLYTVALILSYSHLARRKRTVVAIGFAVLVGFAGSANATAEAPLPATAADAVPGVGPGNVALITDTLRVRFALADRLHVSWARATIIRPAGEAGVDIIVVSPETTVADMEKAVRMLLSSHASMEYPLPQEVRGHVSQTYQTPAPGELVDELTRVLSLLSNGEKVMVPDHGELPALEVDLPVEVEVEESA